MPRRPTNPTRALFAQVMNLDTPVIEALHTLTGAILDHRGEQMPAVAGEGAETPQPRPARKRRSKRGLPEQEGGPTPPAPPDVYAE